MIRICCRVSRPNDFSLEVQKINCQCYIRANFPENIQETSVFETGSSESIAWMFNDVGFANTLYLVFSCVDRFSRRSDDEFFMDVANKCASINRDVCFVFVDQNASIFIARDELQNAAVNLTAMEFVKEKFEVIKADLLKAQEEFKETQKRLKTSRDLLAGLGYKFGECPKMFVVEWKEVQVNESVFKIRTFEINPVIARFLLHVEEEYVFTPKIDYGNSPLLRLINQEELQLAHVKLIQETIKKQIEPLKQKITKCRAQIMRYLKINRNELKQLLEQSASDDMQFSEADIQFLMKI